ncbi:MAG TPA: Kdo hydroxylase family protein [Bryobacteraceae bacterium]|jgi:hypothetical protein
MRFVTIDPRPTRAGIDYRPELEAGNVLFFPFTPFELSDEAKNFLRNLNFAGGAVHKNVAYRTASDRVTGIDGESAQAEQLLAIMREYSRNVVAFSESLLPEYAAHWKLDYASFRPLEEQGRDLPLNKRNDLIHTDAFPSRPTNGDLILRVFTNIHPSKDRSWVVTDPFPVIAEKYAREGGLSRIASGGKLWRQSARLLKSFGLPVVPRSPYDRFMLHFHEYLKRNADFQASCPKYAFDFPPGSTWLTFTDVVPHSVHSGQHALEQTFIVARRSMANPEIAPLAVLERLCGRRLVPV